MERLGDSEHTLAAPGDIGTVVGCESAVETAIEAFGGLDILVNNAGVGAGRPIVDCDEAMWDAHADVNLKGLFFCCRAAIPELRKSNGNIVNIASDAGLMGVPGITVYCGTKGGVINMSRAMALEIAPDVRVNCVCPGYVDTDMIRNSINKRADPARSRAEDDRLCALEAHRIHKRDRPRGPLPGVIRGAFHHRDFSGDRRWLDGWPLTCC